jgi:hypothetical protein
MKINQINPCFNPPTHYNTDMQTRIQITIKDDDSAKLFDKQLEAIDEITLLLQTLPFETEVAVFDREPDQD